MIKKIEGLKRFLHARIANTKEEFENQGRVIGYNEAINDVVKLLNINDLVNQTNEETTNTKTLCKQRLR